MKIILGMVTILAVLFLSAPQDAYRIVDFIDSDSTKFNPVVVGQLNFSDEREELHEFTLQRSGYYEFGVLINEPDTRIATVEKQFSGDVLIEIYSKQDELVFSEIVTRPKYFKPIESDIDYARKIVFLTVPLNSFKYGKGYYIKLKLLNRNDFLTKELRYLYISLSGYY
ncbi:hypothetical protein ACPV5L_05875 [Vibrio astriarenae]